VGFISLYCVCYSSAAIPALLVGGRVTDRVGEHRVLPHAIILTWGGLPALTPLGGAPVLILAGFMTGGGTGSSAGSTPGPWLFRRNPDDTAGGHTLRFPPSPSPSGRGPG